MFINKKNSIVSGGSCMNITACPDCGSRQIYQGTIHDGVLSGYTSRYVCKVCGYQGMPLEFSTEKSYQKFVVQKKHAKDHKE